MAVVGEIVILVPGFMGSRLSQPGRHDGVWLDPIWNLTNIDETIDLLNIKGPDDRRLMADQILERVPLGAFSPHVYSDFITFLSDPKNGPGYRTDQIRPFFYDWRRSMDEAADDLDALIGRWSSGCATKTPIVIIAHSFGCLVAAHALFTGRQAPARTAIFIALGAPFGGLTKTLAAFGDEEQIADLPIASKRLQGILPRWPACYDLMPFDRSLGLLVDATNSASDPLGASLRSNGFDAQLAAAAWARLLGHFRRRVDGTLEPRPFPVPVRSFVGSGIDTPGKVTADANGGYSVAVTGEGDGTVPAVSGEDFACADPLDRRIYPLPYVHHVAMVDSPLARRFLRTELFYGGREAFIFLAIPKNNLVPVGGTAEAIVEIRDGDGHGLSSSARVVAVALRPAGLPVSIIPSAAAPDARVTLQFTMPPGIVELSVSSPNLPGSAQPATLRFFPA